MTDTTDTADIAAPDAVDAPAAPRAPHTVAKDLLDAYEAFKARISEMDVAKAAVQEAAKVVSGLRDEFTVASSYLEKEFEKAKEFL